MFNYNTNVVKSRHCKVVVIVVITNRITSSAARLYQIADKQTPTHCSVKIHLTSDNDNPFACSDKTLPSEIETHAEIKKKLWQQCMQFLSLHTFIALQGDQVESLISPS